VGESSEIKLPLRPTNGIYQQYQSALADQRLSRPIFGREFRHLNTPPPKKNIFHPTPKPLDKFSKLPYIIIADDIESSLISC
jgi:hypothetical protein